MDSDPRLRRQVSIRDAKMLAFHAAGVLLVRQIAGQFGYKSDNGIRKQHGLN